MSNLDRFSRVLNKRLLLCHTTSRGNITLGAGRWRVRVQCRTRDGRDSAVYQDVGVGASTESTTICEYPHTHRRGTDSTLSSALLTRIRGCRGTDPSVSWHGLEMGLCTRECRGDADPSTPGRVLSLRGLFTTARAPADRPRAPPTRVRTWAPTRVGRPAPDVRGYCCTLSTARSTRGVFHAYWSYGHVRGVGERLSPGTVFWPYGPHAPGATQYGSAPGGHR